MNREMIKERFPKLIAEIDCGIYCESGWDQIIFDLCQKIVDLAKEKNVKCPTIAQLKEKFGGLRFYLDYCSNNIFDDVCNFIAAAEKQSTKTCEFCGKEGLIKSQRGWLKAVCDQCDQPKKVMQEDKDIFRLRLTN